MAEQTDKTASSANGFGQRAREIARATNTGSTAKKPSLLRRRQADFELKVPRLPKSAWIAMVIVPAPFMVPFFWPEAPGSLNRGFNSSAAASVATRFVSVVEVKAGDAAMDAAITRARAGLQTFFDRAEQPEKGERAFAVKVALPTRTGTLEHVWATQFVRIGGDRFQGQIANQPANVDGIKIGSVIEFSTEQISDWMFRRDGKIVGYETLRPLLQVMPERQAAELRMQLASN